MIELLIQTHTRPSSSEICMDRLFNAGVWPSIPIRDKLKHVQVPICFMYGEKEYME